jgi:nucleoside-diphosphate-sugar epimerase
MARAFDRILITGGSGYCGSTLVPQLLRDGYSVTVYDLMLYGDYVSDHRSDRLAVVKADIRDKHRFADAVAGHDVVLHLASIPMDARGDLDAELTKSVNFDAFAPMVDAAKNAGVRRFAYASSSSVYGVSEGGDITEASPIDPSLTLYGKYKALCEPILFERTTADFVGLAYRPATVCGYSPRQRFDLSLNAMINHAMVRRQIIVPGPSLMRAMVDVQDFCRVVRLSLTAPDAKVADQTFNVGFRNLTLREMADLVVGVIGAQFPRHGPIEILETSTSDLRSYRINSDKSAAVLGMANYRSVEDSIADVARAIASGALRETLDDSRYYSIQSLKRQGFR